MSNVVTIATHPSVKMSLNDFLSRWPGAEELIDLVVERRPGMGDYYYWSGFYPALTVFPARFRFSDDLGEILSYDIRNSDLDTIIQTSIETLRQSKQAFCQYIIDYFSGAETLILCALDRVRAGYFPVGRGEKVLDGIHRYSIQSMFKQHVADRLLRIADWLMPGHRLREKADRIAQLYQAFERELNALDAQFRAEAEEWANQSGTDWLKDVMRSSVERWRWTDAYLSERARAEGYGEAHVLETFNLDRHDLHPLKIVTLRRLKVVEKDDFAILYRWGSEQYGRRYCEFSPSFARGLWLYIRPLL